MLLSGKTAVVTGCLQGIGLATLDAFAAAGANVFACCQYADDKFLSHVENLKEKYNVEITPVYFDLMNYEEIKQGAHFIQKAKKPIDILANIAGANIDAYFHMMSMDQLKDTFSINFFSQVYFTQYITKLMLRGKKGSVINVSSISAIDGNPGQFAYSASKAAMIAGTKTLATELGPHGIRVNAVAPGVIKTPMTENLPKEALDRQLDRCELGRIGLPQEVANTILYLASDSSSYITGQVIRIDGGIG
ncbi:SDR family NAD(P)-dependent oxidoreductase [Dickeya zeae]|uniref:SDR family oxidoreductase n=1 Tax=Dickeya zeae TaxID=204042 RepID=A0ABX8VRL8_9GAMM|nr:SDR family oxidoreductase [Dickeya zeae]MCO7261280.1 SDR family oxidoreductase [Dickeya zeae]QYM90534.1 SDR family oxidoreductase [Dickeya zeae]